MKKNVLILREASSDVPKSSRLGSAKIYKVPALAFTKNSVRIPKKKYDFVLLTSKNALRDQKKMPQAETWVFIGEKTRKSYRPTQASKGVVLRRSDSEGIFEYFRKNSKRGQSLFFPRSELADSQIITRLRRLGLVVCVRHTYTMKLLPIRMKLKALFRKKAIDAVFFTSPSTVRAFVRATTSGQRKSLQLHYWAIGKTTAKAIRSLLS